MNKNEGYLRLRPCADARVGGLIGLLVGDALGVPWEFHAPSEIPSRHAIEMTIPQGYWRSHDGVAVGTYSDDGAQALCLTATLIECGKFSLIDFADRLLRWRYHGYMAVDGHVFDCGLQTAEALARLRDGVGPHESGGTDEYDCGNGSVMRALPLALWHLGIDESLVRDAHLQSLPTHRHPRTLVACAFYVLAARGYLHTRLDPWGWADQRLEEIYDQWPDPRERKMLLAELGILRQFPKTDEPRGTGYVLDTIWSARKALEEDSFEDVARTAILFGNDSDTTCAVAAGLAGIRFGIDGIPERWLEQLRGFEIVEHLIDGLGKMSCAIGVSATTRPRLRL